MNGIQLIKKERKRQIDNDHEVEIIIQKNKPQSVWINAGMAQEIIEHLQEQFKLEPRQ